MDEITKDGKERVVCPAVEYKSTLYMVPENSHHFPTLCDLVKKDNLPVEILNDEKTGRMGFITSTACFVDKNEAAKVAFIAGQLKSDRFVLGSDDKLLKFDYELGAKLIKDYNAAGIKKINLKKKSELADLRSFRDQTNSPFQELQTYNTKD